MAQEITITTNTTISLNLNEDELEIDTNNLHKLNSSEDIRLILKDNNVKRGDIIILEQYAGYRDDAKFIYNGHSITSLCYDSIDDHGMIPPSFPVVCEFDIHHWKSLLSHNSFVWVPIPNINEILDNLELVKDENHSSTQLVAFKKIEPMEDDDFDIYNRSTLMVRLGNNEKYSVTIHDAKTHFQLLYKGTLTTFWIYIWVQEEGDVRDKLHNHIQENIVNGCVPLLTEDHEDVWVNDNIDSSVSFHLMF